MSAPDLSVLVVSWNTRDLLRDCLRSVLQTLEGVSLEVIVVDNASSDGSAIMVREEFGSDPRVRLIANPANEKFARGNNQAFAVSRGQFLAIVNSDVRFTGPALRQMMEYLRAHPRVGIAACDLVGTDGVSQSAHRAFPTLPIAFFVWTRAGRRIDSWFLGGLVRKRYLLANRRRTGVAVVDQAAAACLVLARSTVERMGGLFDEQFPIFFNDVDLSRRVWNAGLEVHVLYDIRVVHHGGSSTRQMAPGRKKLEHVDGLLQYYDLHEPRWKGRVVRWLVSRDRRRAARAGAVAGVEALQERAAGNSEEKSHRPTRGGRGGIISGR